MLRTALTRALGAPAAARAGAARRCGILAILAPDAAAAADGRLDEAAMRARTALLTHRGPDGQGVVRGAWHGRAGAGGYALGHQRLAIVDPTATADQPFTYASDSADWRAHDADAAAPKAVLVANGEIYNHGAILKSLGDEGYDLARVKSSSDCEAIIHNYLKRGPRRAVEDLSGMYAIVLIDEAGGPGTGRPSLLAARDRVGIKPLYWARDADGQPLAFASELKALVGAPGVDPASIGEFPAGHFYTPEDGLVAFHKPAWREQGDAFAPWKAAEPTKQDLRDALEAAVVKRMMSDVTFGLFLSGGVDSAIVAALMAPHYAERAPRGVPKLPSFTVGMPNSPDATAARAMAELLGTEHVQHEFDVDEALGVVDQVVYHMETYEAELLRSAIPNWFLAKATADAGVKMVLTGEGADELWAGYAYFEDSPSPAATQRELRRIYSWLPRINLHRTDRMTMAHALEARVPFLDVDFTSLAMSVDPSRKLFDDSEPPPGLMPVTKAFLRETFTGPIGRAGVEIPRDVLWRAKAMQCEGIGENWVATLQSALAARVSDAEFASARDRFPVNTPLTKEEFYYRAKFDEFFPGLDHVVVPWPGGCRAGGAEWQSATYTREGLANTDRLRHGLQK